MKPTLQVTYVIAMSPRAKNVDPCCLKVQLKEYTKDLSQFTQVYFQTSIEGFKAVSHVQINDLTQAAHELISQVKITLTQSLCS